MSKWKKVMEEAVRDILEDRQSTKRILVDEQHLRSLKLRFFNLSQIVAKHVKDELKPEIVRSVNEFDDAIEKLERHCIGESNNSFLNDLNDLRNLFASWIGKTKED